MQFFVKEINKGILRHTSYLITFSVGEFDRNTKSGHEAEYQVKKVFRHEDYNVPSPINNDIALLELEKPILFNTYVQPICLPQADPAVGTECYITGKAI